MIVWPIIAQPAIPPKKPVIMFAMPWPPASRSLSERVSVMSSTSLGFTVQQMRELLDARDILCASEATADAREMARDRLTEYAALAAAACDDMRTNVARGDEFVQQLLRESQGLRLSAADG